MEHPRLNQISYQATEGANKVIKAGPGILRRIIFGADVGSAVVEVSNHASDGDGNVQLYFSGDTLATSIGWVEVNTYFDTGIVADLTNQTNVTFIFD